MPNALKFLKTYIPVQVHVPLPPNLANIKTRCLRVPGSVTLKYTVIAETLPSMPRVSVIGSKDSNGKFSMACTVAEIEIFHDKSLRRFYTIRAWMRLRIFDPSLVP